MHTQYNPTPIPYVNTSGGARMPYVLQLQVSPNMQPYVQTIGAKLLETVQSEAHLSVLRQSLHQRLAQNGFYNKEFVDLATFAVNFAESLECFDHMEKRKAHDQAVHDVVQIAAASEVTIPGNERLWASLPPEAQAVVNKWLNYGAEVMRRADQMQATRQHQPAGYGAPMASYTPQGGYPQGGYPQQQTNQPYYQPGGINRNQPPMGTRAIEQMAAAPTRNFNQPNINEVRAGGMRSSVSDSATPLPSPRPTTEVAMTPLVLEDGYHQQLRSDYGDTKPLPEGSYPGIFNLETAVAFFAFKGGVVSNFIVDKDQCSMRYTDHRNEQLLRGRTETVRRFTPNYQNTDAVLEAMTKQQSVTDMLAELEKRQADESVTGDVNIVADVLIPCLVNLNNSTDYHNVASLAMDQLELPLSIEDSTITYTGINFGPKPYNAEVEAIETKLRNARSHDEMCDLLTLMRDKLVPLYYWEQLDLAITQHVNELLQTMLGIESRMDCYTEEVSELTDIIAKEYPAALERFNVTLLRRIQVVTLDNDSTHLWRDVYDCTDGDGVTCKSLTVLEDITLLPVTSTDINLGCLGNVGVVTAKATPNLYRAARHRIDNAHPKTRWIKFITLDRIVIYIYPTSDGGVLAANTPFV